MYQMCLPLSNVGATKILRLDFYKKCLDKAPQPEKGMIVSRHPRSGAVAIP
jgi:hypothetical protein